MTKCARAHLFFYFLFLYKKMPAKQFRYFILTIPAHDYIPFLPEGIDYVKGQLEEGAGTGYRHWQLLAVYTRKVTLTTAKTFFATTTHLEPTRSAAADAYVWKDDTSIPGTRFELGCKPFKRNSNVDWRAVLDNAKRGRVDGMSHLIPFLKWLDGMIICLCRYTA